MSLGDNSTDNASHLFVTKHIQGDLAYTSKLSWQMDIALGIYLSGVCVGAMILNMVVLVTMACRKRGISPLEIYIINLAVADLVPAVIAFPLTVISNLSRHWMFGHSVCAISAFLVYFFGVANITTLTVMSVTRYVVICRHQTDEYITKNIIYLTFIPIYINASIWSVGPLLGWGEYGPESFGTTCSLNWITLPMSYVTPIFLFDYCIPLVILVFCYSSIVKQIYISQKGTKYLHQRLDLYMTKMAVLMTLCFVVAWSPYAIVAFTYSANKQNWNLAFTAVATYLAKTSSVSNPVVYFLTVKRFRHDVRDVFWKCLPDNNSNHTVIDQMSDDIVEMTSKKSECQDRDIDLHPDSLSSQRPGIVNDISISSDEPMMLTGNNTTQKEEPVFIEESVRPNGNRNSYSKYNAIQT